MSPDGRRIAFTSTRDGPLDLYVMDATGDNVRRLTTNLNAQAQPSWSPDGTLLAASTDYRLCVWDARTGALLHALRPGESAVQAAKWKTWEERP